MPLTTKGEEIKSAMEKEYGAKKGEQVFYASKNKGTITGVDSKLDAAVALARGDMSGKDFDKLKETMDKWIEEEKKEPEHRDDASIKAKTEKVSKQGSSEQAKRIANDLKGARKESIAEKLDAAVVLSDAGASLSEVKRRAKEQSKKGYVQHVNEVYPGVYKIEDWYDSEQTICSYENGHEK